MKRFWKAAAMMVAGCGAATAQAGGADSQPYVFVDGFAVQHEERIPDRKLGFGARVGVGIPIAQASYGPTFIEFGAFRNGIEVDGGASGDQTGYFMIDLVQNFKLAGMTPFIMAGVGAVEEKIGDIDTTFFAIEAGGGLTFDAFENAKAKVGITAQSVKNDLLPGQDEFVDLRFLVGLQWGIGDAVAPVAAPAKVTDSDGDGLADAQDKCPSTPASTADGCPMADLVVQTDTDGDGVYDSQDACADTLSGLKVDASGCAVQTESQSVVLKGVTFLPGSATLTADARTVLDGAAASLSADKSLKVEIGGYTDSQGRDATNLALSQKRADSARQYLIGKGVEGSRLTAKGYGEASPIADNDTAEGRAENRRVELKVVK